MPIRSIASLLLPVVAACASTEPSRVYWRSARGASPAEFSIDNQGCAARASRVAPTGRADLLTGGAAIPDNRIDRPPERWVSAVAEKAYIDCMGERGWRLSAP